MCVCSVSMCACVCVWQCARREYVCVRNKSVCACAINVSPESMEPIWGETNLPAVTGDPGTARTPWALCALCRLGLPVTLLAPEEDILYVVPFFKFKGGQLDSQFSFVERFLLPLELLNRGWVFYKYKFNFPRMRSKIGNESMQSTSTTAQNIHHGSNRHRYSNALRKQFCYTVTIVAYKL